MMLSNKTVVVMSVIHKKLFFCIGFFILLFCGSLNAANGSDFLAQNDVPLEEMEQEGFLINFNNLDIIEVIKFISKISGKNFIFDEDQLNFRVTIVSEEPTSIENIMTALLQVLRINGLTMIEQGNNILIHGNSSVNQPSRLEGIGIVDPNDVESQLITRVFKLNNLDTQQAADLVSGMISKDAQVKVLLATEHLIVTDFATNIERIAALIQGLDTPRPQTEIGQYVIRNIPLLSLVSLTKRLLSPIAGSTPYDLIPDSTSNSIFIVSSPYLVERAISIMQTLDLTNRQTRIMTMDNLKYVPEDNENGVFGDSRVSKRDVEGSAGDGRGGIYSSDQLLSGVKDIRQETRVLGQELLKDNGEFEASKESTGFRIYKLQNRQSDNVEQALQDIGSSLSRNVDTADVARQDLVEAIRSVQEIPDSNSIVFSGSENTLDKVEQLIRELDVPLRQVFIEMLVLQTSVQNALNFGVEWGMRFNDNPNWEATTGIYNSGSSLPNAIAGNTAADIGNAQGFNLGVIGSVLKNNGNVYATLGGLVQALQTDSMTKIMMNPKIITEDTQAAEVFVGTNTRFLTSSISNDTGTIVTSNFEFRDIGTLLRVTPYLGDSEIITLQIEQEITNEVEADTQAGQVANDTVGPTTSVIRTTTRVHIPDRHFLVLSGMIQETKTKTKSGLPCLGGLPGVGAAFSQNGDSINKQNVMLFVRPIIVDTADELRNLTRDQHKLLEERSGVKERFEWEIKSGLDFLDCDDFFDENYEEGCAID